MYSIAFLLAIGPLGVLGQQWGVPPGGYPAPAGGYPAPPGGYQEPPGGWGHSSSSAPQPTPTTTQAIKTVPTTSPTTVNSITGGGSSTAQSSAQPSGTSSPNTCGSDKQKISLSNQSGGTLMIQAGAPWTVGECGNIASGATCTFCQDRAGTGGNLQVGFNAKTSRGTWIEGNWVPNSDPTIDVSFIPGYSVPIMCKSDVTGANNGWSTPLCKDSKCSNCDGSESSIANGRWDPTGKSCVNPAGDMGSGKFPDGSQSQPLNSGPCPPFYASSKAGAYCYPNDNSVVGFGSPWTSVSCTAYPQSGGGGNKRDTNDSSHEEIPLEGRDTMVRRHRHGRAHARRLKDLAGY